MTDINNLNINQLRQTYKPSMKKEAELPKEEVVAENIQTNDKAVQPGEILGRSQVKKLNNPEMIQSVKDSIDFFTQNPDLVAAAVKAGDQAYDLMSADDVAHAYEKACVGSCEAAYSRA